MKKLIIPIIAIILLFTSAFTACKKTNDGAEESSGAVEDLEGASAQIRKTEAVSHNLSADERMSEMVSLVDSGNFSVLDMTVNFWYPEDLDAAIAYSEDFEYDKKDVEIENNIEVDSYWLNSKTDFPIAQRSIDEKGRVSQVIINDLDGTYRRITYMYETDDGSEADEGMTIEIIDNTSAADGNVSLIKSYQFQFYPNDKIYSAIEQYYDDNGEAGDFYAYLFDPDGNIIQYIDPDAYTQMLQERILSGLGGIFEEIASSVDLYDIISQAGLDQGAGLAVR